MQAKLSSSDSVVTTFILFHSIKYDNLIFHVEDAHILIKEEIFEKDPSI